MLLETAPRLGAIDPAPQPALHPAAASVHRIAALVKLNMTIRLRDPFQMIAYIVMPMLLMLFLKPLYVLAVDGGTTHVVTGMLVMFSVFAVAIAGNAILVERTWRTWDRLRVSRATSVELLLGKIIPIFLVMVLQQTILLVYGCLVIGVPVPVPRSWALVALAIAVWAFALLSIGAMLATIVRSHGELSVISDVGALTLSSMGGALVPLSIMPGWAQGAAHASPGFWALEMMKAAIRGDVAETLVPAGVLLAIGVAAGAFAVRRLTRGWGRSRLL